MFSKIINLMKGKLFVFLMLFVAYNLKAQRFELKNKYPVYHTDTVDVDFETAFNRAKHFVFRGGFSFQLLDLNSGIIQTSEIIQDDYAYENEDGSLSDLNKILVTAHQYVTQLSLKKGISQPVRDVPVMAILILSKYNNQTIVSRRLKIGVARLNPMDFTVKSSGTFERNLIKYITNSK